MKKLLLASAALAVLVPVNAMGADPVAPEPYVAPVAVAPAFSWTGFYVGLNAGAVWGEHDADIEGEPGEEAFDHDFRGYADDLGSESDTSFIGGAQIGVNRQFNQFVLGIEGDIQWTGLDAEFSDTRQLPSTRYPDDGHPQRNVTSTVSTETEWLATIRGRAGVALDGSFGVPLLLYATGGVAFANVDVNTTHLALNTGGSLSTFSSSSDDQTHTGWTIGTGVEGALSNNVSLKLEYLYFDLGDESYDLGTFVSPGNEGNDFEWNVAGDIDLTGHILRAGINYRF